MASRYAVSRPIRADADASVGRVPKAPTKCDRYGCGEKADVLFMVVDDHGRERCGAALDFANEGEKTHALTMRGDFEFVRWIARCAKCYQGDVDRSRRGKWNYTPTGTEEVPRFLTEPRP